MPCCNTTQYKRLQRVLCCSCNYTAHAAKQRTKLYRRFSCDSSHSTAYDTRPAQTDITPPVPRWSVSQRPDALQHIPDTTATPGRCTAQRRPPIIIRYIRSSPVMDPCQTVQQIAGRASPAGSRCFQRLALCFLPGTGGAEPLAATAAALFGLAPNS